MASIEKVEDKRMPEGKQVGETFYPFSETPDLSKIPLEFGTCQILSTCNFFFKNTPMSLELFTFYDVNSFDEIEAPLGPVGMKYTIGGDGIINVEDCPLALCLKPQFMSIAKYEEAKKYALELKIGKEIYHLKLSGDNCNEELAEDIIQGVVGVEEGKEIYDDWLKNANGGDKDALLPLETEPIRSISVRIIEKEIPPQGDYSEEQQKE